MGSIKEIVIVDIPSQGELSGVFADLILALSHSISSLGFKVSYERSLVRTTSPVIIFGLYRLFINKSIKIQMPENYFIFNLAPIMETKAIWFQDYIKCLSKHKLIDYSFNNIYNIGKLNADLMPAHFFDFGFFDLMPFRGIERSDNYIFYGKLNEDRMKRLKSFQSAGLKLNIMQNIWGHERDIQIRKAKAVVNIGKYDPNILEVYRIWHSLCLGTPVYSDAGIDKDLAIKYSKYVCLGNHLEVDSFLTPPKSANLYQDETSFIESTKSLLNYLKQ